MPNSGLDTRRLYGWNLPGNAINPDISSEDYVNDHGFIVQIVVGGDLTYRPIDADADVTQTFASEDRILACGIPLVCGAVRMNATVTIEVATF